MLSELTAFLTQEQIMTNEIPSFNSLEFIAYVLFLSLSDNNNQNGSIPMNACVTCKS